MVRAGQPLPPEKPEPVQGAITLDQVRGRYDIAGMIRQRILEIPAGQLIHERELCLQTAGKDIARFRRAVENNDDLKGFRVKLRLDPERSEGCWYYGSRQDVLEATRLRDE